MHIPSYKVHNVLKVYSEQLRQRRTSEQKPIIKGINKEDKGKRQAIIKKVAVEIFDRITRPGIHEDIDKEIADQVKENGLEYTEQEKNEFIFNTINDNNKKITGRLLISDANVLIKQLEQIVKKVVNKKT